MLKDIKSEKALQQELDNCKKQIAAQNEALQTKHDFEQILSIANRAIGIIGFEREVIWLNKLAESMVGLPLEQVRGKMLTDLVAGNETDRVKLKNAIEDAKKGKITYYENTIYTKNNEKLYVRFEVHPLYNVDNNIDKICMYAVDVTKELEHIKRLTESEQRYQDLLLHTSDIFYSLDSSGTITNVNNAWTKLTGYTRKETIGKTGNAFLFPTDLSQLLDARQRVLRGEILLYNLDMRLIKKNGKIIWLNSISTPIYSDTKEIVGFTGISRDITEQKKIQLYYQLLSKNIRDLVFLIESKTVKIRYVSPSVKEITGYNPEDLIGRSPFEFCHPDDIEKLKNYRQAQIDNTAKLTDTVIFRYPKKDGSYTWLELTAKVIYDEETDTVWAVTSAQVADVRKMEEEKMTKALEEEKRLNRIKSSFLQFVSHEFKAPLSIIKGLCELMKMNIDDKKHLQDPTLIKDITGIENESEEMISLIEEVLLLEESETGRVRYNSKPLDMAELIKGVSKRVSLKQKVGEISTIVVKGAPKPIRGDSRLLEIVFLNLLSNAFKYSAGKPIPIVAISYQKTEMVISVKDFGIGIPERGREKLFTTFFRADNVSRIDGTGLGLSIVKNLVEMHKGSISCISKEGKGTEMKVRLPYAVEGIL